MSQPTEVEIRHPADLVPRLAALIHSDALSNGERARLKRTPLIGAAPLAYTRFLMAHVPETFHGPRYEFGWRALLAGLAMSRGNPHNPNVPFGQALKTVDVSELRLESLLSADERVLATLALRAARRLAAKAQTCNWRDIAWLIFPCGDAAADQARERIARAYFRNSSVDSKPTAA